jgi:hypothetical protein
MRMAATLQLESDNLGVIRISGLLKKSEMDAIQKDAAKELSANPRAHYNVLIIVENFQGWEGNVNWGDMSFYAAFGDRMQKIAIVGDPKREADFIMFMGGGIRPSPVKYFPTGQLAQARAWLERQA